MKEFKFWICYFFFLISLELVNCDKKILFENFVVLEISDYRNFDSKLSDIMNVSLMKLIGL